MRFQDLLSGVLSKYQGGTILMPDAYEDIMVGFKESHQKAIRVITKTKQVRDLQKKYFSSRRPSDLSESKKAEAELDALLNAGTAPKEDQKQLFN